MTPRKSLQSSFYLGQPGSRQRRRRVSSGFCVIVSFLIKVKGVSWIFSPLHFLLDICCFQVEEMLKGWSLSRPHTISNRRAAIQQMCPALILAALHENHSIVFFHGTDRIASILPRALLVFLFLDATGTIVNYSCSKFLEHRFSFSVLWR